jgi:MFS family permease
MAPSHAESLSLNDTVRENHMASTIDPMPHHLDRNEVMCITEESLEARIERLGRQRPDEFHTIWSEVTFVFSICMSQLLTEFYVSGFTVILPTLIEELKIPQASSVWPATAFSLVIASTLLVFGRLGDMWGGYTVFIWGLAWLLTWSVIAGFSVSPLMLVFCRALQGLGAAAFLPTGVMLMGTIYRPGPRKNLVFALYGTAAVMGFFSGILVAGIVGSFLRWGFYFWIGAILTAITLGSSIFSVPNTKGKGENDTTMDWPGAATIVSGLVLVVFAITESAHAEKGWRTPYILILFVLGCLLLVLAIYIEGWVAKIPLLPADIFAVPAMKPLLLAMLMLYGTWGIFSVYGTLYFQHIMGATPIQVVAWYVPLGVAGLIISVIEGYILHLVPGRILLIISAIGALGSQLLLVLVPRGGSYWEWIFPATILSTIGIDLSTILMTVFITTNFPSSRQGLAGGLINSVLQLGVALCLGFTDLIQSSTVEKVGLRESYKNTFWFGLAAGIISLVLMTIWGKIPKATSDLTPDEKLQLEREALLNANSSPNMVVVRPGTPVDGGRASVIPGRWGESFAKS